MATTNAINANSSGLVKYDGAGNFDAAIYVAPTSWTPSITFGRGSTGITYGFLREGTYARVGNIIFIQGAVNLTNKGSSTGVVMITGLPFQPLYEHTWACRTQHLTYGGIGGGTITLQTSTSAMGIYPVNSFSGGAGVQLTDAECANNSGFIFTGYYFI